MKKIISSLLILAMLNVTLPLRAFQTAYNANTSTGTAIELVYSNPNDPSALSASEEAKLFSAYKQMVGWDNMISNYGVSEEILTESYNAIDWDSITAKTGVDVKALLIALEGEGVDLSYFSEIFNAAFEDQVGGGLGYDKEEKLEIVEFVFLPIITQLIEMAIEVVFKAFMEDVLKTFLKEESKKIVKDIFKDVILTPAPLIGVAIHILIELIKFLREQDKEDAGIVVYQSSNAIVDPDRKDKYKDIGQDGTEKASIGIYVKNVHYNYDDSSSYVYNVEPSATSTEAGAYGYYHKNTGAAEKSTVGGVMNSTFTVYAGVDTAAGIYTLDDTGFSGGDVTTANNSNISLGVSYNTIIVADGTRSKSANTKFRNAEGLVDVYGIYADGDWSAISVIENNIVAAANAGDVVGIDIKDDQFSKELLGNNIYVTTYTGAATGIRFDLDDDDDMLEITTISGATTNNSPATVLPTLVSYFTSTDAGTNSKVSSIEDILSTYFADSNDNGINNAVIIATNTADGDTGDGDNSTAATGILFTGGDFNIGTISDYNILASSLGTGAYGIAFDHTDEDCSMTVDTLEKLNIVVDSVGGLAVGIYLDTSYYDDDGTFASASYDSEGNLVLNFYNETFISTIQNLSVTVNTYGNVYGYVSGSGFGYDDSDGGFAFYNSGLGSSDKMADNFDYSSISISVTSNGSNPSYTGANAFGLYLCDYIGDDMDFESIEVAAIGEAFGLYLDDTDLVNFGTTLIVNTIGDISHGVYLIDDSSLYNLSSSITFNSTYNQYSSLMTLIGVEIDEDSYISNISADISFNIGSIASDFIINAIYLDNASNLNKFSGSASVIATITSTASDTASDTDSNDNYTVVSTYTDADTNITTEYVKVYTDENFYGYLLGASLLSGESLLLYNNDTKNSEGISVTSDASISIDGLESSDKDKNVYGAYITGSDNADIEIDFDINVTYGVGLAVYDGATVSLEAGSTVSGKTNIIDGAGSVLTVTDGSYLEGGVSVSNSAALYFEGDRSLSSATFDVNSSASLEITGDVDFHSLTLNISDSSYLKIINDIDFFSSSLNLSDGATLMLEATTALYFDSTSTMTVGSSYIVLDLSTETELSDYVIAKVDNSTTYDTILYYLTDSDITSVILSDVFATQTYSYATYGDNTGEMEVSYSAKFTGDGTDISVTVVASGVFDYFKWVLDDYGNYTLELASQDDQSFSAYSSADNLQRIVNETHNEDIDYSFINLSSSTGGGAIYTKTSDSDFYIGNITGDFVGNYGSSSGSIRGGAIYNYTGSDTPYIIEMGAIKGSFIGNYVYSETEFTRGGAISNMSDGGSIAMGIIYGDFKGNYAYTTTGESSSQGGAIYNYTKAGENTSITMDGIEGDFIRNYVFSGTANATGGAIFNESNSSITIDYITANFLDNYVYSISSAATGGAIYNYACGAGATSTIDSMEASFIGNYAYSETGSAEGGAIYNHTSTGGTATITLSATEADTEFTGNYVQVGDTKSSSAIYNYGATDSNAIINFVTNKDYTITVNDEISGNASTAANQILNIDGDVSFNNSVKYQMVNLNGGTLSLGSYEGTDDLYDNNSYVAVDASTANLVDVVLSVADGATLNVSASDVNVSSSDITLSDGSYLVFDLYAGMVIDADSTFTIDGDVDISVDFTGIYEEFNYTLFDFDDEVTYQTVLDYLSTSLSLTLSYDILKSLNYELDLSDVEYGDTITEVNGNYTLSMQYDDDDYTISLDFDFTGHLVYFEWTLDDNGNLVLEAVDILGEVGTKTLSDIQKDFDFSAYSLDNTRVVTSSDDIDYSFIALTAAEGAAIYLSATDTALTMGNLSGDFVANIATSSDSDALGGAIYNASEDASVTYENLTGTFLANRATSTSNDAKGGAIYNNTSATSSSIYIEEISGDYEYNYAYSASGDAFGGAISNDSLGGTIEINNISADFDDNYTYSANGVAAGGAISNESIGGTVQINDLYSSFDGNYAYSTSGDAKGGAIYNSASGVDALVDITISGDYSGTYTNNYASSTSGTAQGGAIYNSATEGGEIAMTLDASSGNIVFTGNYINNAGDISSNAIYNYADANSLSTINFVSTVGTYITLNDAISGGADNVANQILNIDAIAIFNNTVENQTVNINTGLVTLGRYTDSDDNVISTASLDGSTLNVGTGTVLTVAASDVIVSNSDITFSDGSTLYFSLNNYGISSDSVADDGTTTTTTTYYYLDSYLDVDSSSNISFEGDVSISINPNDMMDTFEGLSIFKIDDDDLYTYVLDYLSDQYITVNIGSVLGYYDDDGDGIDDGYVIADYGDNFYNISVAGDDENNTISISTYLAGEFSYFEWVEVNDINNTVLMPTDAANAASAAFAVYSASNKRIIGSEDANTDTVNLETSFAGLEQTEEHGIPQGAAIYNESSTTSISIGDIDGDFVVNSANATSFHAQGGAIYSYADTNDISMGDFNSYFMGNSAFTTSSYAQGGAIYNYADSASITIANLIGDFEKNYTYTLNNIYYYSGDEEDKYLNAEGGAIYNYVSNDSNASISIAAISGDFNNNFVYASNTSAAGGAIYNETYSSLSISSFLSDFTTNYAAADTDGYAKGGAVYNYAGEGASLVIDGITGSFKGNYVYSKTGDAQGGAIYNYAQGGTIDLIFSMIVGSMEFTGNYTQNNYVDEDGSYTVAYNAIYNAADATGTSTLHLQAGDAGTIIFNDGITGDSVAVENQILSVNYMDENTEDSLCGTVEFNDLVENQTITLYNGTINLGSYAGTSDLLADYSGISVIASSATLAKSSLQVNSGASLSITGDNVTIESSVVTFESGSSLSINTSGYLYIDSDSTFDVSGITDFSVIYDGTGFILDESTDNTYISELIYIEDSSAATSIFDSLSELVAFEIDVEDVTLVDDIWDFYLSDNTIYISASLESVIPVVSSAYSIISIIATEVLTDIENIDIANVLVNSSVNTAISLDATSEITTTISGEIIFISDELATYNTVADYFSGVIVDEDAFYDFYLGLSIESDAKTAIEVNSNNVILAGEIYAKLITEDESDDVVAVKTTTGTLRLAADTVIISEIYDSNSDFVKYATAITNSHEEGEDSGLNLILQGGVAVLGNIVANSPFSLTSEGVSEIEDGVYAYNISTLYLYGDLTTANAEGSTDSEDVSVETASLYVYGGTIDAGDGDINLIGGNLILDENTTLTTTGSINITTDIYGTMGTFEYDELATFINDISISIEGGGVMLVGQELDISDSIDLSSFISAEDYKYGDFDVVVDADTNATSVIVKSLSYFQEVKANNANEKALAILLDEMTYTADTATSKLSFKSLLDVAGLDSVMMNNYSNIAEVNTILLSNLNFESVNRARAILAKTAGSYLASITEEEVIEEATGVDLVEAEEVAIIKYSKVAQLQSINLLGSKDSVNGVAGYDYWSVGSLANLDNILSEKALVGVSIGGTYNKTEGDTGDSANSTTFLLNAYGVYANEGLEVFGNIGYAHFWNEGYKSGISADWDSDAFNALVGVSYDLETTLEGLTITPLAMLNLVYLNSDSANYSDSISVASQSYLSAKLMLGLEAQYAISERFNSIFRLMYGHECGDTSYDFAYGFSNGLIGELDYIGAQAGADSAVMGVGLSYDFSETCTAFFDYNAHIYSNLITHSLNLSIAIEF